MIIEPLEHRRLLAAYDISTGPNLSTPSINGAIFQSTNNKSSAGTGNIDSFLRVQATGTEQGFNTDAPATLDAKSGNFTRSLLLSDIPLVNRQQDGVNSAQFALDIGQLSSSPLLSLDQVKIYLTDSPVLTESPGSPANFHNFGTPIPASAHVVPVYNLDAGTDNYVLLTSAVAGVSGPSFSVNKNGTNQTVATNTAVKLTWPSEAFDTNNNFASDRFTPTVMPRKLYSRPIQSASRCAR
jgi:hypothetical protein